MARIRNIKPEFFLDFELAKQKAVVRLFFIGLWTQADKEGRLKDEPEKLKVQIIPWEKVDAETCLKDLHPKFITRYKVNDQKFIQINNFQKHQVVHSTERISVIPPLNNGEVTVTLPETHVMEGEGEGEGKLDKTLGGKDISCRPVGSETSNGLGDFELLWGKYPNKDGKAKALLAYKRTVKSPDDVALIDKALANYLASRRVKDGYIKNGSTWFNNWRDWIDYVDPPAPSNGNGKVVGMAAPIPGKYAEVEVFQ